MSRHPHARWAPCHVSGGVPAAIIVYISVALASVIGGIILATVGQVGNGTCWIAFGLSGGAITIGLFERARRRLRTAREHDA